MSDVPESLEVRRQQAEERKKFLRIARDEHFAEIRGEMVNEAYGYLGSLGVTLWSDWDITDPERRQLAAEWLVDQVLDIQRWSAEQCDCDECVPK